MRLKRYSRILFVTFCVGMAWYSWTSWSTAMPQYRNEALMVPTFLMYALAIPASLIVQVVSSGLEQIAPSGRLYAAHGYLDWILKTWAPLTIAGYWQWFVLVPRLLRR
jgi:hypothetical protein